MFKTDPTAGPLRALIASADAEQRRRVGEIAKEAELRAVGFIREAEQVSTRTLLSMPDVLLLDAETFQCMADASSQLSRLHDAGAIKVILFGQHARTPQGKHTGIDSTLDLASPAAKQAGGLSRLLRDVLNKAGADPSKALGAQASDARPGAPMPVTPAMAKRKTLVPGSVVIGSSTGGPVALMTVLKGLPKDFPLPVAVVQHMPPGFTRMLAERLNAECALRVVEASDGMQFEPGTAYIAPGGFHMELRGLAKAPRLELNTQDPENSCRPAVDVLFRSSAKVYGGGQHAIVLTGMGRDGLLGATHLHGLGARVVVQDAATSTVWGMPGAIAQAGYADEVLPVDQIAPHLLRCL